MKKIFILSLSLFLIPPVFSQTESFDIATFAPPQGWQRSDAKGALLFYDSKTENELTSFCQIILYLSAATNTDANKNFAATWKNLVTIPTSSKSQPITQTDKTADGWTVVTGSANIEKEGLAYKTIVASISGFGKTMSVQVNTAGGDYAAILDQFFNTLELKLDSKTTNMNNSAVSIKDYDFIAPQNWQVQNKSGYISIRNLQSGCEIKMLPPQTSSGNLETDARSVFDLMYKGWQYQKSGEQQYILFRGFLPKGLEYCMMEAAMSGYNAAGQYILEEGTSFVIKAGNQIAIVSVRHNSSMWGHDDCYKNYNTWARFVNSFTIKNAAIPANNQDSNSRIVGLWTLIATGVAVGDYAFFANGNYQSGGGLGSSTTTTDQYYKYIHSKAYAFEGDGSYSISDHILTLRKKGYDPEQVVIRFEKVNHGGIGWTDRLHMLKQSSLGEYETVYEKQGK